MHKNKVLWLPLTSLLMLVVVLSGCGGQASTKAPTPTQVPASQAPAPTEAPTMTEAPTATPTEAPATTEAPTEAMAATTQAQAAGGIDCMGAKSGDTISMLYLWSGTDEENLKEILKPLMDACGIGLKPESAPDQAQLDALVKAGTPPDIAFTRRVSQLAQYKDLLKPMTDLAVHAENYADYWKNIGSVDGNWLGLPVKVDIKTLIWYSPVNFRALGYRVPTNVDALFTLLDKMVSDGKVPWSSGFESGDTTGQTGADFIEDVLLIDEGPDYVNGIIDGSIPYNDPGVNGAYQFYGGWAKDAKYTIGGAKGTLSTNINDALYKVFSNPPEAMMVRQSGRAGGVIAAKFPNLTFGSGYDFFQVPGAKNQGRLHGRTDWMTAFSDSAAVKALVAYLSSAQGGQMWAQVGFGTTPNMAGTNAYTDKQLKKQAQILAKTKVFVPEIGDAIPGEFASVQRKAIVDYINGADLDTVLNNVAAVQMQALGK